MRALLMILSALGAAILIMSIVKGWQIRRADRNGLPTEAIETNYILGAIVGLVVFAIGVFWLESDSASPNTTYVPAKIQNGIITEGGFEQKVD